MAAEGAQLTHRASRFPCVMRCACGDQAVAASWCTPRSRLRDSLCKAACRHTAPRSVDADTRVPDRNGPLIAMGACVSQPEIDKNTSGEPVAKRRRRVGPRESRRAARCWRTDSVHIAAQHGGPHRTANAMRPAPPPAARTAAGRECAGRRRRRRRRMPEGQRCACAAPSGAPPAAGARPRQPRTAPRRFRGATRKGRRPPHAAGRPPAARPLARRTTQPPPSLPPPPAAPVAICPLTGRTDSQLALEHSCLGGGRATDVLDKYELSMVLGRGAFATTRVAREVRGGAEGRWGGGGGEGRRCRHGAEGGVVVVWG